MPNRLLRVSIAWLFMLGPWLHAVSADGLTFSNTPLFTDSKVPANLVLALSVEWPTTMLAYRAGGNWNDGGGTAYKSRQTGYFDPAKCYSYDTARDEFVPAALATVSGSQFYECGGSYYSGNFMNWLTMSGIDLFRQALTGGNRTDEYAATSNGTTSTTPLAGSDTRTALLRSYLDPANAGGNGGRGVQKILDADKWLPSSLLKSGQTHLYVETRETTAYFGDAAVTTEVAAGGSTYYYCLAGSASKDAGSGKYTCTVSAAYTGPSGAYNLAPLNQEAYYLSVPSSGKSSVTVVGGSKVYGRRVQVRVCDRNTTTSLPNEANCQSYKVGTVTAYKPVGEIQNNYELLRMGLFSYRRDGYAYGGVMRSPVKDMGLRYFSPAQNAYLDNAGAEWDAYGRFRYNPDPALTASTASAYTDGALNSGIINHINRFGATGNYKSYDPMGTMVAEIARYFRGEKTPDPDYVGSTTATQADGFPVIKDWSVAAPADYSSTADAQQGPIRYPACQRNFLLSFGDDNTWGSASSATDWTGSNYPLTSLPKSATESRTLEQWTADVLAMEKSAASNPDAKTPEYARYDVMGMLGVSYWLNQYGLKSDGKTPFRVKTYVVDVNESTGNNLNVRRLWTAAKYGGFDDSETTAKTGDYAWLSTGDHNPNTCADGSACTTEWYDPNKGTYQSQKLASTYTLVSSPALMASGIRAMFRQIAGESSAVGTVAASSGSSLSTDTAIYRAGYKPGTWVGTLEQLAVDPASGQYTQTNWEAGALLTARTTERVMLTYDSAIGQGIPFAWNSLTAAQKTVLKQNPQTDEVESDADGQLRLAYLRGSQTGGKRSYEMSQGGRFRDRDSLLGDIVDSSPVMVSLAGSQGVAVGSNDGMLHLFDTSGQEKLAYLPNLSFGKLNQLTAPGYSHSYFVDGGLASYSAGSSSYLAGGLGYGARGVFVLDLSNSANFAETSANPLALLEYGAADDVNVGHVFGAPQYATLQDGNLAIVFGNGHNAADYKGRLYILYLTRSAGKWSGSKKVIETNAGSAAAPAGLAQPVIVRDAAGRAKYAYAGDMQGNLWKFDLSTASAADWKVAFGGNPLYVAKDAAGTRQPITAQPQVVTKGTDSPDIWIAFQTGKYLEKADTLATASQVQTAYVIKEQATAITSSRTQLTAQGVAAESADGYDRTTSTAPDSQRNDLVGWYFDFPDRGERGVSAPSILLTRKEPYVLFPSMVPADTTVDACAPGVEGRLTVFNLLTGQAPAKAVFDINGDNKVDSSDKLSNRQTVSSVGVVKLSDAASGGGGSSGDCRKGYAVNAIKGCTTESTGDCTWLVDPVSGKQICLHFGSVVAPVAWREILQ
ncbi:pilus assembly protein [Chitinimonas koreensis]|uniref:pilus assembly protein n=1 Tax=Chitinimonas koreensis TaxID=356302 RepID=UPI00048B0A19|nr:PilC/PilY family type IV pilus protein [Chitinimonas koreensis]